MWKLEGVGRTPRDGCSSGPGQRKVEAQAHVRQLAGALERSSFSPRFMILKMSFSSPRRLCQQHGEVLGRRVSMVEKP